MQAGTTIDGVSQMSGMSMPKPTEDAKAAFTKLVPSDPGITLRPMFGNLSAFVNGNMFAGLFGEDLFVRLPDDEAELIRKQGGRAFEPMPGHAMKGYVTVPATWRSKPSATHHFIVSALAFARTLPPKSASGKKAPGKRAPAKKPAGRK
jgi:TfoX/Sxy family transcriptional regulator of competence genes